MVRKEALIAYENYNSYAKTVDVHVAPTSGINSGAHGRDFEMQVKRFLGSCSGRVSPTGCSDARKKINGTYYAIEIKSGCGEIARLKSNGEWDRLDEKKGYVIYAPSYNPEKTVEEQAYVCTTKDFWKILEICGLIRLKYSRAMTKLPAHERVFDRMSIQTFTNSRKKKAEFLEALEKNCISLKEFSEMLG